MSKWKKRPVVVEAEEYHEGLEDGWEHEDKLATLTSEMYAVSKVDGVRLYPYIDTLEGRHFIGKGDWIITGVKGERYPCKPDVFALTYEPARRTVSIDNAPPYCPHGSAYNCATCVDVACALPTVPIAEHDLAALRAQLEAAQQLLEGLTPGGSEFHENPENCAAFVQKMLDSRKETCIKAIRERHEAQQRNGKLVEELQLYVNMLDEVPDSMSDEGLICFPQCETSSPTWGDVRRAAKLLAEAQGEGK